MYKKEYFVTLPDSDAAGILFFGNYLKLAHVLYEEFMAEIGFSLRYIIDKAEFLVLIVHSEADYKKSLYLGDTYSLGLTVSQIGNSSFELSYKFTNAESTIIAEVKTVHVVVSKKSKKAIRVPETLKEQLAKFQ